MFRHCVEICESHDKIYLSDNKYELLFDNNDESYESHALLHHNQIIMN